MDPRRSPALCPVTARTAPAEVSNRIEMWQAEMKVSRIPIHAQAARFLVGGARGKRGYALLYPDNLTTVVSPADPVGYLGGPMVFAGLPPRCDHRRPDPEVPGDRRLVGIPDAGRDDGGRNRVRIPRADGQLAGISHQRAGHARPRGAPNRRGHHDQAL